MFRNNTVRDTRAGESATQTVGILMEESVGNVVLEGNTIEARVPVEDQRKREPQ